MNKIYLSLAIHNHQPVGNFDFVFEEAYTKAYEPMIALLEKHPGVRLALHYSGPLRDWLKAHRPEFMRRVRSLVGRKQIEIMTGGYYEPVLTALPDADKIGQVQKMTEAIQTDFAYKPIGLWLAERVWEPQLPKSLREADIDYTIVDDTHFKNAGYTDNDLFGYYVTEEQGQPLNIFATSKQLRYALPWTPVEEVIQWLRDQADRPLLPGAPQRVAVMGDDGEKFGLWPTTYEHCWEGGWMDALFTALEQNSDWLITCPPAEVLDLIAPLGRVYLPVASYDEMGEWSLPAPLSREFAQVKERLQTEGRKDVLRFLRGGMWRSFMVKYPEVNSLHKRMLWASERVHRMKKAAARSEALDHLWASQCNCPYWHGVFGGVYLFHIREANYAHLIEAQNIADRASHPAETWIEVEQVDVDRDGHAEAVIASDAQWLMFSPGVGGALLEWDWRKRGVNVLNTLTRWREGYHQDLIDAAAKGEVVIAGQSHKLESIHTSVVKAKEPGLEKRLIVDWYRRSSLIDHIIAPDASSDAFYRASYAEWGDFVNQPYEMKINRSAKKITLTLVRAGGVWIDTVRHPLRIEKKITVESGQSALAIAYTLTNIGEEKISARFGVETNWGISGGDATEGAYSLWPGSDLIRLNAIIAVPSSKEVAIVNERVGRGFIQLSDAAAWWQFPIETISLSEAGFEKTYQGTTLLAHWPLDLEPGGAWKMKMQIELMHGK
jgi:hypothetical protein